MSLNTNRYKGTQMARHAAKRALGSINSSKNEDPYQLSERIKKLEKILAIQIERSAELSKDIQRLESELEGMTKQRDCWRRLYRKVKPNEQVPCDRQNAMVVYGEIDVNQLMDRRIDRM